MRRFSPRSPATRSQAGSTSAWREHALHAVRVEVGERALVEKLRVHQPPLGQVVDDHVQELQLIGAERPIGDELAEGPLGRLPIKPDQGANEPAEPAGLLQPRHSLRVDAGFDEDPLQLRQVRRRERLVALELDDREVVLVGPQELPGLAAEGVEVGPDRDALNGDLGGGAHPVLEVGEHQRSAALLDQLRQGPKAAANRLQHRQGHVLPELVGLDLLA